MSKTEHTGGEWKIRTSIDSHGDTIYIITSDAAGMAIAGNIRNPFNAKLIASAPDLLHENSELKAWRDEKNKAFDAVEHTNERLTIDLLAEKSLNSRLLGALKKSYLHVDSYFNPDLRLECDKIIAEAEGRVKVE